VTQIKLHYGWEGIYLVLGGAAVVWTLALLPLWHRRAFQDEGSHTASHKVRLEEPEEPEEPEPEQDLHLKQA
jgi:hypothetical protein